MLNKTIIFVILRTIAYILSYISYVFFTFVAVEFVTILLITIMHTNLEKIFFLMVSYTPTLGFWGKSSFHVSTGEIMQFIAFWSFILIILHTIIPKVIKLKIHGYIYLIIFSLLHVIAMFRLPDASGMVTSIVLFYAFALISFILYRGFAWMSQKILHVGRTVL